jgi:hypothetical protein
MESILTACEPSQGGFTWDLHSYGDDDLVKLMWNVDPERQYLPSAPPLPEVCVQSEEPQSTRKRQRERSDNEKCQKGKSALSDFNI